METGSAGPLSAAAQAVMAVLRAQYAGRTYKNRHSELGTEAGNSHFKMALRKHLDP